MAAAPPTSTITVLSTYQQPNSWPYAIVVGGKRIQPPSQPPQQGAYWFVVLDRTNLNVVYNVMSASYNALPQGLSQYDSDKYIMAVTSVGTVTMTYPQGPLFDWLVSRGGTMQLRRLAQACTDIGCANIAFVCYALVSVLGPGDYGFDKSAFAQEPAPLITLQLLPVDVAGTYYYTPITLPN